MNTYEVTLPKKECMFENPTKVLSKKFPYLRRCRRDAEMPLSPFFFFFCNCAVVPNDGIEQAARVCTNDKEKTSICTHYRESFPKIKVFKCLGSILSFHLTAPIFKAE